MKHRVVDLRPGRPAPAEAPEPRKKAPLPRERRSTLREKKRRMRALITAGVSVCVLLTIYAVHLGSYMERFTYQHVSVKGAQTFDPALVESFAMKMLQKSDSGFISGRNIFVYKLANLEGLVMSEFPNLKKVSAARDTSIGNGITLTVTERTSFARWCTDTGTQCYKLDDTGIVFASAAGVASSSFSTPYVFVGPLSTTTQTGAVAPLGEGFAYGHLPGIITLLTMLGQAGHQALGASVQNSDDFFVPLAEGFYIKASFGASATGLARNLDLVLASDALRNRRDQIEYVDLRFGNRVYYKLKGQPEVQ